MDRMTIVELTRGMSGALNRVAYKNSRIRLTRRGKDVAVLVPVEDAELLERLEDEADLAEAGRAMAEMKRKGEKPIPWEKVKKELFWSSESVIAGRSVAADRGDRC